MFYNIKTYFHKTASISTQNVHYLIYIKFNM